MKTGDNPAMEDAAREVWNNCSNIIQKNINEQSYHTWIKPIKAIKLHGSVLTIQVPSEFFKKWLVDNYVTVLENALRSILGNSATYQFEIVHSEEFDLLEIPQQIPKTPKKAENIKISYEDDVEEEQHPINERYTFEN
ncbi:MAG: hypothetical protein DWQ10_08880, partial [Calditrichaeota bacterium]